MRVFMYFNLHRLCWSLKALEGPNAGRVVAHAASVRLSGCSFKVSEAGRQRVLSERRKNVHAGIVGTLQAWEPAGYEPTPEGTDMDAMAAAVATVDAHEGPSVPVTYNPYRAGHFHSADMLQCPMHEAPAVTAIGRRVVAHA